MNMYPRALKSELNNMRGTNLSNSRLQELRDF